MRIVLALLLLLSLSLSFMARADEPELLDPAQAFRFSARALDAGHIEVRYQIAPGYYLYRERFKFSVQPDSATLGAAELPQGVVKKDAFFGEMQTYRGELHITLPVKAAGQLTDLRLTAQSQGCADVGVCYPPNEQHVQINMASASSTSSVYVSPDAAKSPFLPSVSPQEIAKPTPEISSSASPEARIEKLFDGSRWLMLLAFLGFGLALAFTPCMLPLIPILAASLAPQGNRLSGVRGFLLASFFVLGMAITYALAGVAAAKAGTLLSSALQNVWVLSAFAMLFVVLALGMFGVYEIQLPTGMQSRLAQTGNKLRGGHVASVFVMGVVSALIVGPCIAPPLAGALLFIGKTGNATLGGAALFAMAVGMGLPLLAIGGSTGILLPKAGPWMEAVKRSFGVLMLAVALYLISPVLPPSLYLLGWAGLLVLTGIFLRAVDPLAVDAPPVSRIAKGVGILALFAGCAMLTGALAGSRDPLHPLAGLRAASASVSDAAVFQPVASLDQLQNSIRSAGKPAMLDFYADWCVSCKEMERDTFTDPTVRKRLDGMALLRADVTQNLDSHKVLLKHFELFGPPGIVFFDAKGNEVRNTRVVGFQSASEFAATLDQVMRVAQ